MIDENKLREKAINCRNRFNETAWLDIDAADLLSLLDTLAALRAELLEQARVCGMGSEREARLMAQVSEMRAERDALVADARRYRFTRSWLERDEDATAELVDDPIFRAVIEADTPAELDAAIDQAIAKEPTR